MDDGYGFDELKGVVLIQALTLIEERAVPCIADLDMDETNKCLLASAAGAAALDGDLSPLEAMSLGGETQYDPSSVSKKLKTVLHTMAAEWKDSGRLTAGTASTNCQYQIDIFCEQGRRPKMEDRHLAVVDLNALLGSKDLPPQSFFAIYDGHGGVDAAAYAQAQLHIRVAEQPSFPTDPVTALVEGFLATDAAFLKKAEMEGLTCGATACTVLIRGTKLYVAWLGDSQAMLCKQGNVVELMDAHKPQREDEKKRIEEAEGVVVWYGAWRVNGILSVARAIGDRKLKQWVIGRPDVNTFDLDGTEEYLILGCDGLWDVMDNAKTLDRFQPQVVTFIRSWRESHDTVTGVARALVEHCIDDLATSDNISIILVFFNGLGAPTVDQS